MNISNIITIVSCVFYYCYWRTTVLSKVNKLLNKDAFSFARVNLCETCIPVASFFTGNFPLCNSFLFMRITFPCESDYLFDYTHSMNVICAYVII